jgi:sec-independent protein translocase protein TatA
MKGIAPLHVHCSDLVWRALEFDFAFMNTMFAAFLGGWEIVLILAVVLILFGAKKLPELAKGLGQGIKEFKKASSEVTSELQRAADVNDYSQPQVQYHPPEKTIEATSSTPQPAPASEANQHKA